MEVVKSIPNKGDEVVNEAMAVKVTLAGVWTALITKIVTDTDLLMVLIVGVIGGLAYVAKEFMGDKFKESPIKYFFKMVATALMSMGLVGFVFYLGRDGFNTHIKDLGDPTWIFLAFMAGLNQKVAIEIFSKLFGLIFDFLKLFITSWFGAKNENKS